MQGAYIDTDINSYRKLLSEFLFRFLKKRSGIKDEVIPKYINDNTIDRFVVAFTHVSFDPVANYEYYETLGDATINKCTAWYFHRKFPSLQKDPAANYKLSLLKTQHSGKESVAKISTTLGLAKLVRYRSQYKDKKDKIKFVVVNNKFHTDIFESLMGCIEDVIDNIEGLFVGAAIVYNIVSSVMDQESYSLEMEEIVVAKTRLNELKSQSKISRLEFDYKEQKIDVPTETGIIRKESKFEVRLFIDVVDPKTRRIIKLSEFGPVLTRNKGEGEKILSKNALKYLKTEYGLE